MENPIAIEGTRGAGAHRRQRRQCVGRVACFHPAIAGIIMSALTVANVQAAEPPPRKEWVPVGRLDTNVVKEASGIVRSRRHPGIYWTHGDSGTSATLFAFGESGRVVATVQLAKATNTDWEDIAADDNGNLYVGDIGNNMGVFPARYVYVVPEPDLSADPPARATWSQRWKYKYPDDRFNAECLFVLRGRMYIISIGRKGQPTIYRLDPVSENECKLTSLQHLQVWMAQGADVSPDGKRLAVCTNGALWVFGIDENAAVPTDRKPRRVTFPRCSAEACCFDGADIIILTEAGFIHRVTEADVQAGTAYTRPPKKKPANR